MLEQLENKLEVMAGGDIDLGASSVIRLAQEEIETCILAGYKVVTVLDLVSKKMDISVSVLKTTLGRIRHQKQVVKIVIPPSFSKRCEAKELSPEAVILGMISEYMEESVIVKENKPKNSNINIDKRFERLNA